MSLDKGIRPNDSYDRGRETVNIGSGNLNIEIPLVHLPGRDGHDFTLALTYNSQNWTPVGFDASPGGGVPPGPDNADIEWKYAAADGTQIGSTGWQLNIPMLYATEVITPPPMCDGVPCGEGNYSQTSCTNGFYLVMGDGGTYQFQDAVVGCTQLETTCQTDNSGCSEHTYPDQDDDYLIDYDYEAGKGNAAPAQGQGVMLDLTNAASGSGTAVVRFRDGSQMLFPIDNLGGTGTFGEPPSEIVDPNGNVISINTSGNQITDTLGRTITISNNSIQYKDSNGTIRTIALNYSAGFPTSTQPTFTAPAVGTDGIMSVDSSEIYNMLSSVVLPDGLSYTFQYNIYGEIVKITYPSGGYTRYAYAAFPVHNYQWTPDVGGVADNREVIEKYTCTSASVAAGATTPSGYVGSSAPDTCPVAEQDTQYQRPATQVNPVTVVDPEGNKTIYNFGTCSMPGDIETSRQVYQGASTLLRTVTAAYQGCLKMNQTVALPNGLTSETTWTYDTAPGGYWIPFNDRNSNQEYWGFIGTDNLSNKKEYGFGQGSPGPLQRQTIYNYLATNPINNINYQQWSTYILNRELSETVQDGSGNQVAQTTYEYDNYRGGIAPSGAVQHGTSLNSYGTSYTTRGNATSVTQWVGDGVPPLTTINYQFDDSGNVLSRKDPAGNTTLFQYGDAWGNTTCEPQGGNGAAYVTQITDPAGLGTKYTWNSCTGTMASVTDTNQQSTTFAYDVMDRRIQADYPGGGQTCLQYSDDAANSSCSILPSLSGGSLPVQIETTKKINASENETTLVTLDGLSRPVQSEVLLPTPLITDTTYDANGNVASVSNLHYGGGGGGGVASYQYDALDRKVIQDQQDGSFLQWCFDGTKVNPAQTNCSGVLGSQTLLGSTVDYSDETGRHWQRTSDALGNLIKVMEQGQGTTLQPYIENAAVSPVDETDYTYDALGNLKHVDQWNGSYGTAPDVQRSFNHDGISRLVTANNPESGQITYSYQRSGALCSGSSSDVCSRTDANGTVTTYSYDPDGNLTGKSYTDTTPPATYVYQYGAGSVVNNANGRLVEEYTGTQQSPLTERSIGQYDATGRIQQDTQCLIQTCASPNTVSYGYDDAGNVSTLGNGVYTLNYTYDTANRLTQIASNRTDLGPDTLFLANAYGPFGLTSADLGYSSANSTGAISLERSYDIRERVDGEADTGIAYEKVAGQGSLTVDGGEQSTGSLTKATGSVTINGSEQSKQTPNGPGSKDSTGTLSISGNEQSKASTGGVGSHASTGAIEIDGFEQSTTPPDCPYNCPTVYDDGTIEVSINGTSVASAYYGEGSTSDSISSEIASEINRESSVVSASGSGGVVLLTSKTTGSATNYSYEVSVSEGGNASLFDGPSFEASTDGPTMTGGTNGTIYDSGTVSVTVNGHVDSVSFGQGSSSSSIQSSLINAINGDGGDSVTASPNGTTGIVLTSKNPGSGTNWPVSASVSYDTADFSSSSFGASGGGMSGGVDGTVYDSGSVTIIVNGHSNTVSFGDGSTQSTIASALANAINGDGNSPVTATPSGTVVSLETKQAGANVNYSLSGSDSHDTGDFPQSSFTTSPSGPTLTGGSATIYDAGSITLNINGTAETVSYGQTDTQQSIATKLQNAFSGNSYVVVAAAGNTLQIMAKTPGASTDYAFSSSETYNNGSFTAPSFSLSPASGALTGASDATAEPTMLYFYSIPSTGCPSAPPCGYDLNGNVVNATDKVTGTWSYSYDALNRLKTGSASAGYYAGLDVAWGYDTWGNRIGQTFSGTSQVGLSQPSQPTYTGHGAGNTTNRADQFTYDSDGNVLADQSNSYLYDAEGRLCAVDAPGQGVTLYLYDAEGRRVAKGSGSFSCNMSTNGFTPTKEFLLGLDGEQLSEYDGGLHWIHSNVFLNGRLLATYSAIGTPLTFALTDWVGTKRVQAKSDGEFDTSFSSLPYGDQWLSGTGATEQFFTSKPRDTESGNDYFGARYYASSMGRFMSPDWSADPEPVPYAQLTNPQSLNLYSYVFNDPLNGIDPDGHSGCDGNNASVCNAIGNAMVHGVDSGTAIAAGQRAMQPLSAVSEDAIEKSPLTAAQASAFEDAALSAGRANLVDPNLIVGLASTESSLNPTLAVPSSEGSARGLFQITPPKQKDLKLTDDQVWSVTGAVPAVAGYFRRYINFFGNHEGQNFGEPLAIASWTMGVRGALRTFKKGGMGAVRNKSLGDPQNHKAGINYIDKILGFD